MSGKACTSIGSVRLAAAEYYRSTGQKLSFQEAVQTAHARGLVQTRYEPEDGAPMGLEEFWQFIEGIPLIDSVDKGHHQIHTCPEYYGNFYMREEHLFLGDDDIMTYIHVPFIFDGMHTHDHFEINYVYHGSCSLEFNGKTNSLAEGSFFVLAPDSPHNVFDEDDSLVISVMVRKTTFDTVFSSFLKTNNDLSRFLKESMYRSGGCLILESDNANSVRQYMQSLMLEFYKDDPYHNINAICMLFLVFSLIVRSDPKYSVYYDFSDSSAGDLSFAVLIQYIKQNYSSVSLSSLSNHFHYSESFLSRLIQRKTGEKFSSIVKKMKMEHARSLLLNTGLPVKDISDTVGYDSPNHFSRAFKDYYGVTPVSIRNGNELGT